MSILSDIGTKIEEIKKIVAIVKELLNIDSSLLKEIREGFEAIYDLFKDKIEYVKSLKESSETTETEAEEVKEA